MKGFDEKIPKEDAKLVVLKPEIRGGSVGITLAGGIDYEVKAITVKRKINSQIIKRNHHNYFIGP